MSVALIQESAKEIRRLAIAGSALAVGDFRLKKLIAPLEQAGANAPVFTQVAKAISDLVEGKEAESAAHLLQLSTLLNAILYTQGQTGTDAPFTALEIYEAGSANTRTSARVLKPLIEALMNSGGGRFEVVKSAFERGAFNDLRLIDPAIHALGDNYPELADLVAEKILPAFGPGIGPRLKQKFDPKGKTADGRRLTLMHRIDPVGTLELCKSALEEGSPEVKVAAIKCLGTHEDCLPLIQEQANSKNKVLRAAALEVLAGHDRPEITKLFVELVQGKALDLLAQPFRLIRNQQVLKSLFSEGQRVFTLLLKGDEQHIPRFTEILDCLERREDTETEQFLVGCFQQCEKLAKLKPAKNSHIAGEDLLYRLGVALYRLRTPKALETILAQRERLPTTSFGIVMRSALLSWTPDKVFEEFSPLLTQKRGANEFKHNEFLRCISAAHWNDEEKGENDDLDSLDFGLRKVVWDPRWLDAGLKADSSNVVYCLARPGHHAALDYLIKLGESKKACNAGLIIRALARCQYPKITDYFLNLVTRKTKGAKYFDDELQFLFENARHLPPADLPKLEALVPKLDEKFADFYLQALAPLRPAQPTES